MARESVLIIEDEPDIVELVQYNLEREGFQVFAARDGENGVKQARERKPSLVLLDLMLPGIDGLEVCRQLRQGAETRALPLIMLTAKSEESDVVLGLGLGADDYITKPFSPRELIARVRAQLRREERKSASKSVERLSAGGVLLDALRHEVSLNGEVLPFTRAEFRLLWTLLSSPGRVFSRNDLVDSITAGESIILDRNVDVHISSIRKKLGAEGDLVVTVRGVGYKCKD
jgi:DNA-binding response OmpR family regulator